MNATLTVDVLKTLDIATLRALAKSPAYAGTIAGIISERVETANAEVIAFSNQTTFVVPVYGEVNLAVLMALYHSTVALEKSSTGVSATGKVWHSVATPELWAAKKAIAESLEKIKAGKKAQGETFNYGRNAFRTMFEPNYVAGSAE